MTRIFTTGGKKALEANGIRTRLVENLCEIKDDVVDVYIDNMKKVFNRIRRDKGLRCLCRWLMKQTQKSW